MNWYIHFYHNVSISFERYQTYASDTLRLVFRGRSYVGSSYSAWYGSLHLFEMLISSWDFFYLLFFYGDRIIISLAGLQREYFPRHKEKQRWTSKNINDRLTAESSRTSCRRDMKMVYCRYGCYAVQFTSLFYLNFLSLNSD